VLNECIEKITSGMLPLAPTTPLTYARLGHRCPCIAVGGAPVRALPGDAWAGQTAASRPGGLPDRGTGRWTDARALRLACALALSPIVITTCGRERLRLVRVRLRYDPQLTRSARSWRTLSAACAGHRRSLSQPMRGTPAKPAVPPVDPQGRRGTERLSNSGMVTSCADTVDTQPKVPTWAAYRREASVCACAAGDGLVCARAAGDRALAP
jgi:hypothetical protein